jgi:hypothetical protein
MGPPKLHSTDPVRLTPAADGAEAGGNGSALAETSQETPDEEPQYLPMPPRRRIAVSVTYQVRGRGQPLPYPLAEDDAK